MVKSIALRRSSILAAVGLCGLLAAAAAAAPAAPPEPIAAPQSLPALAPANPPLSLGAAIHWALENNPELAAQRRQHGVAAAGVVVARAYPFNPVWESRIQYATGPTSAGITNRVPLEELALLEVEVRGQARHRRAAAAATLTRTDWEIANQEIALAIRVLRAFDTVIYRYQKNQVLIDTLELNRKTAAVAPDLVKVGKLRPADLIVLRTEIEDARAQQGMGRTALAVAWSDLRRALGITKETFDLQGDLTTCPLPEDLPALVEAALEQRADHHAREAAVAEADARLRLEVANRFGNPTMGPAFSYDPTQIASFGVQFSVPLPVLNTHRGEIQQRRAERIVAAQELRQTEVQIEQDVQAALSRFKQARAWADVYQTGVRPELEKSLKDIRQILEQGEAGGVTILQVLDVQRKLIRARDGELDALFEARQAAADLAAAVGDPSLAVCPCPRP